MPADLAAEATVAPGPAKVRWDAGKAALAGGAFAAAREHFAAALEFHPAAADLLLDMVAACQDAPELAAFWCDRYARAASDAKGRVPLDAATRKRLAAVPGSDALLRAASELTVQRAAAIAELQRFVEKNASGGKPSPDRAVVVRWASELLFELGAGAPALLQPALAPVAKVQDGFVADCDAVYKGLARLLARRTPPVTADQRMRAARLLLGFAHQAAMPDLQGPAPRAPGRFADDAQRTLDELRGAIASGDKVWSIDELAAMNPAEAAAFTNAHATWAQPGIALSPKGRYRIETICGHTTLLAVARTIELHHARLVAHFGSDPFVDRQGTVRIDPEHGDLETDGAPFWWAGGFQSGDVTTVRFAWGTIAGLGHGLTHELTHRFDGVLRPFLPAWYGEGHAEWTSGHYGKAAEPDFTANHLKIGTPAHAWYKGYGDRKRFELLLAGKPDDYRDNYFAGYSLYALLTSYPPDRPRYREQVAKYLAGARGGSKDPLGYFTKTFCDGKQGRPASLDELFTDWCTFLRGCYDWLDDKQQANAWVGRYGGLPEGDRGGLVLDPPTWSWARARHEPFFGQDHAARALLLLHEAGEDEAAVAAGVWSLSVDGWRPDTAQALLAALRAGRATDASEACSAIAARRFPNLVLEDTPTLLAALPKTRALLEATRRRATDAAEPVAPPRHLGGHGWTEDSLVDFDERRTKNLWYATPDGDLHVGREKPRDTTGTLDRTAHQRHAFAHSVTWLGPGSYVLRGRVHFTTSFVSGAIVFGLTRRDRTLRLHFASGDFRYAIGKSEQNESKGKLALHLAGLWERDGRLPETDPRITLDLPGDHTWFDYAIWVRGPRVLVAIDGAPTLRYAVHDGTPIEGQVGFAMDTGAVRVQSPTVQRLPGDPQALATGLDLARPCDVALDELLLLGVRGLPPDPAGTLVLWLPPAEADDADYLDRVLPSLAKLLTTPHEFPAAWVLAVPHELPAAARERAAAALREIRHADVPIVEHRVGAPLAGPFPWVLFVDGLGVLRAATPADESALHDVVQKWSRLFRAR